MKKTKIICTVGPSTQDDNTLKRMIKEGMNVARFNFSHGSHESHKVALEQLRRISNEMGVYVGALLDTKGPDIRLKEFTDTEVMLIEGESFTLYADDVEGDKNGCAITFPDLAKDVELGTRILLNDGLVELIVTSIKKTDVVCEIKNSGIVKNGKSVNVPGVRFSMPYMTKRDSDDIAFGIENGFDFIAASFVSRAQDVLDVRRVLDKHKCKKIRVIAKIENAEGVENIDEILAVSDGIMIARGDMGVEIDMAQLPAIQKKLIHMCYNSGKPAITATQMLESMIHNPRPTRAEVSDVANAVYDRTSAVMLSGETAAGKYPVEAVRTMAAIIEDAEKVAGDYGRMLRRSSDRKHSSISDAICHAACATCIEVNADAVLTVSISGETARLLSKHRPSHPIYACVTEESVARQLSISWGVYPLVMPLLPSTDEVLKESEKLCLKHGYIKNGDMIVVVAGLPVDGNTNMLTVHLVGDTLIHGEGVCGDTVTGIVRVCRTDEEVIEKLRPGQILVTPSTSNSILPYIKQAAAIITEEAGMRSHAAIVGLTLDKPVIIGADNATSILRDGMKISIDAAHGVVHLIER